MTHQPYPSTSGVGDQAPTAQRPQQPPSIRMAVRFTWSGAGLALLSMIFTLIFLSKIKTAALNSAIKNNATAHSQGKAVLTLAQMHSLANSFAWAVVATWIVSALLWAWMAWAINRGASWARIVGSALFAILTILVLPTLTRAGSSSILVIVEWLVGLGATFFLWRRDSSEYFAQSKLR